MEKGKKNKHFVLQNLLNYVNYSLYKRKVANEFPTNIPACHTNLQLTTTSASEIQYPCIQGVQSQVHWENTGLIRSHFMCGNGKLKLFFVVVVLVNVCIKSGVRCP